MNFRPAQDSNAGQKDGRRFPPLHVELPDWIEGVLPPPVASLASVEERMRLAIELSRLNIEKGTGGPFGAAIFDLDTHRLLAVGVNVVLPANWSGGHGEIMAVSIAQQMLGTHTLGAPGMARYELLTSTEPCAMCMGAICWSGLCRLVCAARDEDARAIGFDEGPKLPNWPEALHSRGIEVVQDVLRDEAVAVLQRYRKTGGLIYNGRMNL
jgi:tRNA(Arg) A34 adenosine deaminase TadA